MKTILAAIDFSAVSQQVVAHASSLAQALRGRVVLLTALVSPVFVEAFAPPPASLNQVLAGTENAYKLAKKYNIKTAFGADILFDAGAASRQGAYLAKMTRWYTPAEALKMATVDNGELMALSGFINPYPGKLGVVEAGALADLLLVEGNPLENIQLVADPETFLVVMKDGTIYKNTLPR